MGFSEQSLRTLFLELYHSGTESAVDEVIARYTETFNSQSNWRPLGGKTQNFAVIENQQSSPIASLIEKITNSIDAILMRACLEHRIIPSSQEAPRSMHDAVAQFFPKHKHWDLSDTSHRRAQAENIQILAHGKRRDTSLVIYDNGEGQHPCDFERTFLSLLEGNKINIHFVQGKYNMGGSGAIVFCGRRRYQLIGSRRFDRSGPFGFTLIREHPFTVTERDTLKNTWYEYLLIDGEIPSFTMDGLDLGLHARPFTEGTVIKLFSYDLPTGISDIARDLNQSINEYLFEPALPLYTIESETRYPHAVRERHLYGLKRRLEREEGNRYVEEYFSEDGEIEGIGRLKVTCYVFRTRINGKTAKDTRETVRREFFKNNMSVLFSVNGQVHGHFTSEFVTRTLKMNLLKNYVLVHVDCTNLVYEFRKELFMASRDRLKDGAETRRLREEIGSLLRRGKLAAINKRRKDSLDLEGGQTDDLVRSFAENLPLDSEMAKLLDQVFALKRPGKAGPKPKKKKRQTSKTELEPFQPKRFPSFFKIQVKADGEIPVVRIPSGTERTIRFNTDVENMYFDRVEDPGELQLALLDYLPNEASGGTRGGGGQALSEVFNIRKSSPDEGVIKLHLEPSATASVGDAMRVKATLTAPGEEFDQTFLVKIRDPEKPQKRQTKTKQADAESLGLPEYVLTAKEARHEGWKSWDALEDAWGVSIDYDVVMHPHAEGDVLKAIIINMDSTVWKNYRSSLGQSPSEEQLQTAERKYIASVYFHTLFLYLIMKKRRYVVQRESNECASEPVDVEDYLQDVFQSYYAEFLLNFSMGPLMEALGE